MAERPIDWGRTPRKDPRISGIVLEINRLCLERAEQNTGRSLAGDEWRPILPRVLGPVVCDAIDSAEVAPQDWLIITGDHGRPRVDDVLTALADLDFIIVRDLPDQPRAIRAGAKRLLRRMDARIIDWRQRSCPVRVEACLKEIRKLVREAEQFMPFRVGSVPDGSIDVVVCSAAERFLDARRHGYTCGTMTRTMCLFSTS